MKKYNNNDFRITDVDKEFTVYGWVNKLRNMGGVIFVDLRDKTGLLQVVFNKTSLESDFAEAENLKNEYCLKITGTIQKRAQANPNLATGEVEMLAKKLEILSPSAELPYNLYEDGKALEKINIIVF